MMKGLDAWITGNYGEDHPDNYEEDDVEEPMEYDTPPAKTPNKKYSWCMWNPETERYEPPRRTNSLSLDQWREILDRVGSLTDEEVLTLVDQGRSIQELEPLQSQSSADTADK